MVIPEDVLLVVVAVLAVAAAVRLLRPAETLTMIPPPTLAAAGLVERPLERQSLQLLKAHHRQLTEIEQGSRHLMESSTYKLEETRSYNVNNL
jgi:hypothetical protein